MEGINITSLIALAAAFTTVGGAFLTFKKIQKDSRKEAEENTAKILQEAKEHDESLRKDLDSRIDALRKDLQNLEASVNKDMDHIRDTYNGEIRNLGDKIEDLRTELRNQHGQLVQLLSKMIDNRD